MFEQELSHLENNDLLRRFTVTDSADGASATVHGKKVLLMCSNDYLGLASRPELREAAAHAMEHYGFGSGASRLVSGTSPLHRELEQRIARFKGTETALLFNSGYAANTGIIPAIAGVGDLILSDSLNHASIIDGCRLSKALLQVYRHRDVDHAEDLLRKNLNARRKLIVTDSVFSMDGDIAPLPELAAVAEKYGALLMVDDAHATGVLGKTGRGSVEYFGLEGRVPIQMGTLGKALGCFGAYIAGSRELIDYLVNHARSMIFSTALPPLVCGAAIAALDIVEREPELREKLWMNRERFVSGLHSSEIATGASETPIVPIIVGQSAKALKISKLLFESGIFSAAIRPPTVAERSARIRLTVTASHVPEHIDRALKIFNLLKQDGYF
jgi:glycine C-acetyltransferase/8-amino-7-oxononanoate synthase